MKKLYTLFAFLLLVQIAMAQKVSIRGQVLDTLSNAMPSATIMLMNPKDSSLVNFGVSDGKGFFEIRNVNKGSYDIKITYLGFRTFSKRVVADGSQPMVDVGKIKLEPQTKELGELVIKGDRAPVTVKRDTIEFNAASFKTKANANVEDLLKKLPGVEVETDGTVRAQGEQVQKVLVDGREFFGRDPKLATRNLPADAIDKVQVFDKKSDQAEFTGIEDGQREKTINLELKEDKRNGLFGNVMGGLGSDNRYQVKGNVNRFGKGEQLSFLGMGNNINEQGFSMSDFMNFTGSSQQMAAGSAGGGGVSIQMGPNNSSGVPMNFGGRPNGITTNYAGGVNYNKDLSKKTTLTSSYFYNHIDQDISKITNRINYLPPDSSYSYDAVSRQLSASDNHKINLVVDHKLDSANSIKLTTNVTYSENDMKSLTGSETTTEDGVVQNQNNRNNITGQTSVNLSANALWRHRFDKKGRSLSTNLQVGYTDTDSDGSLIASNWFLEQPETKTLQTNTQQTTNQSYGATVSYTEPLGGRKYLEANYNFRTNQNAVVRDVLDVDNNGVSTPNELLSNEYTSNYIYNRPGLNFRLNRQKYSFTAGASYQMTQLKGDLISQEAKIDRTFDNVLPSAHFNYDFSSFKHLRFDYETSMQEPTVQQLQPVVNNSDPLNLSLGNPTLEPAYNHRANLHFTLFDPAKFLSLFAIFSTTYTKNAIANSQFVTPETFVRITKPVNVKDNLSLNGNLNFGVPLKKLNSRFSIGPTFTYSESISILQTQENGITKRTLGGSLRYNYTFKEILTVDLGATLSHQETFYDFSSPDQVYFNKTYTAESNINFLKNYSLNGSFEYLIYNSETTDYHQTIPLLNLSISRFLLKNKSGELKIGVNNLLDYSLSVTQSASDNYLQQETTNNLGRYYMVSFTYSINRHLNPMGGRQGGMRMMIRQ